MSKLKDLLLITNSILLVGILIFLGLIYKNSSIGISKTVSPSPSPASYKTQEGFLEYLNSFQKIRIEYPKDWTKKEYDDTVFVEFKKGDYWDFNVANFTMNSNPTLSEYKKSALEQVSTYKDYKLLEEPTDTNLGELPGFKILFTAGFDKTYKIMQVYAIKENHSYSVTYRTSSDKFDAELPTIEKVIKTFSILP